MNVWRLRDADSTFEHIAENVWAQFYAGKRYPFVVVAQHEGVVDLYDKDRDLHVRLTPDACWQRQGNQPWQRMSEGGWQA